MKASERKHTPAPWRWTGNAKHGGIYLATIQRGTRVVMDFVRKGMNGAQPRFQPDNLMVKSDDLLEFIVGDHTVRGLKAAEENVSVYRYDVRAVDCPDARLIAQAPALLDALEGILEKYVSLVGSGDAGGWDPELEPCVIAAREVVKKVDGEDRHYV
jgi:hypothetical protein